MSRAIVLRGIACCVALLYSISVCSSSRCHLRNHYSCCISHAFYTCCNQFFSFLLLLKGNIFIPYFSMLRRSNILAVVARKRQQHNAISSSVGATCLLHFSFPSIPKNLNEHIPPLTIKFKQIFFLIFHLKLL